MLCSLRSAVVRLATPASTMSRRLASKVAITQMDVKLPLSMSTVEAVYIPPAKQIYSFHTNKLFRFSVDAGRWYPVDSIKGLPGSGKAAFTADERLYVVGQTGMTVASIEGFEVRKRPSSELGEDKTASPFEVQRLDKTPKFQHRFLCSAGSSVLMFGETYLDEINNRPCNVAVYSSPEQKWLDFKPKGEAPQSREHLGVVAVDERRVLVFAPSIDEIQWEIFEFDTHTNNWTPIEAASEDDAAPIPGHGVAFTRLGDYVVLTGGLLFGTHRASVDVYDIKNKLWKKPDSVVVGDIGEGRCHHACVAVSPTQAILFGGTGNAFNPSSMYRLDLSS